MSNTLCLVSPTAERKGRANGIRRIRFSELAEIVLLLLTPLTPVRAVLAAEDADIPPEAVDTMRGRAGDARKGEGTRRRFGLAAADVAAALVVPWAQNRYLADEDGPASRCGPWTGTSTRPSATTTTTS